jgi:hypothetical protein
VAVIAGHYCRVFINGADVSSWVRGVNVSAEVDSLVETELTLIEAPRVVTTERGMEFHFGSTGARAATAVGPVQVDGVRMRGIMLREDEDT